MAKRDLSEVIDVISGDVSLKPMLIEFEHGTIKKEEVPKLRCDYLKSEDNSKNIFVMLKSKEKVYKYKGHKVDNDSQLCQRFFVIRNRRTNKVRLASVEQLVVSRYLDSINQKENELNLTQSSEIVDAKENMKELRKAFGSKRSQRGLEVQSKMKLNTEAITAKMEETALSANINTIIESDKPGSDNNIYPKCNRDASCVQDVYKLEDLFTSLEVLDGLSEAAESIINNSPDDCDKENSKFFVDMLKTMPNISLDKIKCLIYADGLLRFLSVEAKKLNNKNVFYNICPLSKQLRNIIFNEFTVQSKSGRTRPIYMRDKGICYILVLLMIIFDYRLDQDFVSSIFNTITLKRLLQVAKVLGFTTVFGQKKWVLKLPLPSVQTIPLKNKKHSFKKF